MQNSRKAEKIISVAGTAVLTAAFALWFTGSGYGAVGYIAAAVSAGLMLWLCLRFVPAWCEFWRTPGLGIHESRSGKSGCAGIFACILLWDAVILVIGYLLRAMLGYDETAAEYAGVWLSTDSRHYMDIARDWYLSEGSIDRLVQLVFLPGYPIAVRLFSYLTGSYLVSGLCVSALSFAGAGCVLYKLLRLDMDETAAKRAVLFFAVNPAAFFFVSPMSESLFLLCVLLCLYLLRRGKTLTGALFGAYACFTRSVGVILLVPMLFELVHKRAKPREYLALIIVPLGFAAYLGVNYAVAHDAFKFMQYQSEHWSQHLGWFFNTAAYQTENAVSAARDSASLLLGLWLPNVLAQLISLAVMIFAAKRLRASYTAYFIAYYVVAIGATWLLSAPRYLAAMPALPAALGLLSEKKERFWLIAALDAAAFIAYFCVFLLRWQVW